MVRCLILSGATSELDLLRPLAIEGARVEELQFDLLVFGTHFNPRNPTKREKFLDFPAPVHELHSYADGGTASIFGETVQQLDYFLRRNYFDVAIILGDRSESLAAAVACHYRRLPIAHIHAGESTPNSLDDLARHSISTLATLHFACDEQAARLLERKGEERSRIFVVGAMANDTVPEIAAFDRRFISNELGLRVNRDWYLFCFHPDGQTERESLATARLLAAELVKLDLGDVLITASNSDEGGDTMNSIWEALARDHDNFFFTPNLGSSLFSAFLAESNGFLGNSSAIIHEAPLIGVPGALIGPRQDGRTLPNNCVKFEVSSSLAAELQAFFSKETLFSPVRDLVRRPSQEICRVLQSQDWTNLEVRKYVAGP